MKQIIDNFSAGSAEYATFRPESPAEIFDFIYKNVKHFDVAWDCGTGNGQVAVALSKHFKNVCGTDISDQQLLHAKKENNIVYRQERAEQTSFEDGSIDLVTVAQAIHWFDFDKFYAEVNRVLKPGGLVAVWTYVTMRLTPEIDKVIDVLYEDITGPYWDKERRYVDEAYQTIPFPFNEIPTPEFGIVKHWDLQRFAGYLRTWSGVKHYVAKEKRDPLELIMPDLQKAWGASELQRVFWPVYMRAGYVE
jgi:SAM-dependent methyltransferase